MATGPTALLPMVEAMEATSTPKRAMVPIPDVPTMRAAPVTRLVMDDRAVTGKA